MTDKEKTLVKYLKEDFDNLMSGNGDENKLKNNIAASIDMLNCLSLGGTGRSHKKIPYKFNAKQLHIRCDATDIVVDMRNVLSFYFNNSYDEPFIELTLRKEKVEIIIMDMYDHDTFAWYWDLANTYNVEGNDEMIDDPKFYTEIKNPYQTDMRLFYDVQKVLKANSVELNVNNAE